MSTDSAFVDFVVDQLGDLPGLRTKAMFGGHGLYAGPQFFGVVFKDRLYLKTDDATRPWYASQGMDPFQPNERQTLKTYYEVPADTIENRAELQEKAEEAASL